VLPGDIGGDYGRPAIRTWLKDTPATILAAIWRRAAGLGVARGSDGDRVELLAGVLGDDEPDPDGHRDHKDGYRQKGEGEGARRLLQCDGGERPQHKPDKEADEPDDAVGDAANAGREDLGGQRRARPPEAEEPEAPGEAEDQSQRSLAA